MKTVIVTRLAINPRSDSAQSLRRFDSKPLANRWKSKEWMENRLKIFLQCAVPSMRRQTLAPDRWVILIDTFHRAIVPQLRSQIPVFAEVLLLKPREDLSEALRGYLAEFEPDILTIRLDSDDLVHPRFVEAAKNFARPNRGINFPHGSQYFFPGGVLVHRWIKSNPTVGFRAVGTRIHIHDFGQHRNVGRIVRIVSKSTSMPMFLKTSHSLNHVPFQPNGIPVLNRSKVYRHFGLSSKTFPKASRPRSDTLISHLGYRLNLSFPKVAVFVERLRQKGRASTVSSGVRR